MPIGVASSFHRQLISDEVNWIYCAYIEFLKFCGFSGKFQTDLGKSWAAEIIKRRPTQKWKDTQLSVKVLTHTIVLFRGCGSIYRLFIILSLRSFWSLRIVSNLLVLLLILSFLELTKQCCPLQIAYGNRGSETMQVWKMFLQKHNWNLKSLYLLCISRMRYYFNLVYVCKLYGSKAKFTLNSMFTYLTSNVSLNFLWKIHHTIETSIKSYCV